ncbi:MAG: hypothetical protein RI885_2576 [Actinomycetota bacterium]
MPGEGFFPPVTHSIWWTVLAVAILLAFAVYAAVVLFATRRRERSSPDGPLWMPPTSDELRYKYLNLISEVETANARGELGIRQAHQRLSQLLRFHAFEASGVRAPQMTLTDLRSEQLTSLTDAVEQLYPGAFAEIERGGVAQSADLARRVVRSWT